MEFPKPMPTSERLPARVAGEFNSDDVFAYATTIVWIRAAYMYDGETGNEGSWDINGEVVDAADVSHWMPMPPAP